LIDLLVKVTRCHILYYKF